MRVSSPIGELPFEPRTMTYQDKSLVIDGAMGAWPARVVIPAVLRLVARPAALTAAVTVALTALAAIRRHR
jgi:hypothetical protein